MNIKKFVRSAIKTTCRRVYVAIKTETCLPFWILTRPLSKNNFIYVMRHVANKEVITVLVNSEDERLL